MLLLLCGCEPRTVLEEDNRKLEAVLVKCQRRIIAIKWSDFITYAYASSRLITGLQDICYTIVYRRHII